jgi:hypothetical protein
VLHFVVDLVVGTTATATRNQASDESATVSMADIALPASRVTVTGGRRRPPDNVMSEGACASANRTQPFGVLFRGEFVGFVIEVPKVNRLLGALIYWRL